MKRSSRRSYKGGIFKVGGVDKHNALLAALVKSTPFGRAGVDHGRVLIGKGYGKRVDMTEGNIIYPPCAKPFWVDKTVARAVCHLTVKHKYIGLFLIKREGGVKGLAVAGRKLDSRDNHPVKLVSLRLVGKGMEIGKRLVVGLAHVVVSAKIKELDIRILPYGREEVLLVALEGSVRVKKVARDEYRPSAPLLCDIYYPAKGGKHLSAPLLGYGIGKARVKSRPEMQVCGVDEFHIYPLLR